MSIRVWIPREPIFVPRSPADGYGMAVLLRSAITPAPVRPLIEEAMSVMLRSLVGS